MRRLVLAVALLACNTSPGDSQSVTGRGAKPRRDSLTVTFLANEGVMLSAGDARVVIDGLFGDGLRGYGAVSEANRALLERGDSPFAGIDAVLATHVHRDHFDASAVLRHLVANPGATFVSTTQALDSLRARDAAAISRIGARAMGVRLRLGERRQVASTGGATIHVLGLPHAAGSKGEPDNVGYVVEIGGYRVLHIGDTGEQARTFADLRLDELGIDVALLPVWYLTDAGLRDVVRRVIRPRAIAVLHMPPPSMRERMFPSDDGRTDVQRRVLAEFPGAKFFARELEAWVVR